LRALRNQACTAHLLDLPGRIVGLATRHKSKG
jgi:hypothetical protein